MFRIGSCPFSWTDWRQEQIMQLILASILSLDRYRQMTTITLALIMSLDRYQQMTPITFASIMYVDAHRQITKTRSIQRDPKTLARFECHFHPDPENS